MQTIVLYRYIRPEGGVTISPVKPGNEDYTIKYRMIADEGKALTDGTIVAECVDVESTDGWTEIDAPDNESTDGWMENESYDAQYAEAGKILLGVSE